jgi:acetylornithine/succinyldiaminopimelate/putrescine aminotransferase
MLAHVAEIGAYFSDQLHVLKQACSAVLDVRGRGLMLGIELDEAVLAKDIQKELLIQGFVTATAGRNVLRFLPPYIIQKSHIDELTEKLQHIL